MRPMFLALACLLFGSLALACPVCSSPAGKDIRSILKEYAVPGLFAIALPLVSMLLLAWLSTRFKWFRHV